MMRNDPRFSDMVYKIDEADGHAFTKMKVRARSELVTLRLEDDINPIEMTGRYLSPKEFFEQIRKKIRLFLMLVMTMNLT